MRMLAMIAVFLCVLAGCKKSHVLEDPQLRPLQEMLDSQLPVGTPLSNVSLFLNTQGYPLEPSQEPGTLVAKIRKIDTQRMEPITARVTFHFDSHDKLTSYDLQRMFNDPIQ
jgi:hypothetical protein